VTGKPRRRSFRRPGSSHTLAARPYSPARATVRSRMSSRPPSARQCQYQMGRRQPGIGHGVDLGPEFTFDLVETRLGEQWQPPTFYGPGWPVATPTRHSEKPRHLWRGVVTEAARFDPAYLMFALTMTPPWTV
jgi:hypothetical protein